MNTLHTQNWCCHCQRYTMHVESSGDQLLGSAMFIVLLVCTCGLGLILYPFIRSNTRHEFCTICGTDNARNFHEER